MAKRQKLIGVADVRNMWACQAAIARIAAIKYVHGLDYCDKGTRCMHLQAVMIMGTNVRCA